MKDSKLQIRISNEDKQRLIDLANKNNMSLTDFIIMKCTDKEKECHDNKSELECTDKTNVCHDSYLRKYYDILSRYNYLEYELSKRISIFNENYTCDQLGMFLWDVEFIEKFKKVYENEWKSNIPLQELIERLRIVYHEAYNSEQDQEKKMNGHITSSKEEYRAIQKI